LLQNNLLELSSVQVMSIPSWWQSSGLWAEGRTGLWNQ